MNFLGLFRFKVASSNSTLARALEPSEAMEPSRLVTLLLIPASFPFS